MEKRRRKVTKDDIGDPLDFKHVSHVGLNKWELAPKTVKKTNNSALVLGNPDSVPPVYSTISKKKIIPAPLQMLSQPLSSNFNDNNSLDNFVLNYFKNEECTSDVKDTVMQTLYYDIFNDYGGWEAIQQIVTEAEISAPVFLSSEQKATPLPLQVSSQHLNSNVNDYNLVLNNFNNEQCTKYIKDEVMQNLYYDVFNDYGGWEAIQQTMAETEMPASDSLSPDTVSSTTKPIRAAPPPPQNLPKLTGSSKSKSHVKPKKFKRPALSVIIESPVPSPSSPMRVAPPPPQSSSHNQDKLKQTLKEPVIGQSPAIRPRSPLKVAPLPLQNSSITRNKTQEAVKQVAKVILQESLVFFPGSPLRVAPPPPQSEDELQETLTKAVVSESPVMLPENPLKIAVSQSLAHLATTSQEKPQETVKQTAKVFPKESFASSPLAQNFSKDKAQETVKQVDEKIAEIPPQDTLHITPSTQDKNEKTLNKPAVAVLESNVSPPARPFRVAPPPPQNLSQQTVTVDKILAPTFISPGLDACPSPISRRLNVRVHSRQTSSLSSLSDVTTSLSPKTTPSKLQSEVSKRAST